MHKKTLFGLFIITSLIITISGCKYEIQKDAVNQDKDLSVSAEIFPTDSFAFYENILLKDSLNTELHLAIASNYYAEKQFDKAIEHLISVCRIDNKNTEAFITLGNVYYDTEHYEKAVQYYEKALLLDPNNVNVRCDQATCYLNIQNIEMAFKLLKKNIEIAPDHAQSHHNLSVVYSQMGKSKEAEEELQIFNRLKSKN